MGNEPGLRVVQPSLGRILCFFSPLTLVVPRGAAPSMSISLVTMVPAEGKAPSLVWEGNSPRKEGVPA
jgi:hypothetical protein